MNQVFIIIVMLLLAGCSGQMTMELSNDEMNMKDMDTLFPTQMASEEEEEVLSEEKKEDEEDENESQILEAVSQPPEPQAKSSDDSSENPLHARVAPAGKKKLNKRKLNSDLVGESDLAGNNEPTLVTDKIEAAGPKMIDILFVVDNTLSMGYTLRLIYNKMIGFTLPLRPYDWRAGFISAEVKKRKVKKELMPLEFNGEVVINRKYITKGTENSHQILLDTLTRRRADGCALAPYCGGRKERPLGALNKFFRSSGLEEGFLRDGAELITVILTDNRENEYKGQATSSAEVLDTLEQYYPGKKLRVYSLTVKDRSCQMEIRKSSGLFYEGNFSTSIEQFADQSGESFSLCASSYTHVAKKIAEDQGS